MRSNRSFCIRAFLLLTAVLMLHACDPSVVYHHYEHTPKGGWEKNDSIVFDIPPVKASGTYRTALSLRTNNAYPFMGLSLAVRQTIFPKGEKRKMQVHCPLIDKNGKANGGGISYYQYEFAINELTLEAGDSVHICVQHNMKREIMPGVTDVGISLTKQK